MKKRYLIVFLFLIFCNINVVKADITYKDITGYNSLKEIKEAVCEDKNDCYLFDSNALDFLNGTYNNEPGAFNYLKNVCDKSDCTFYKISLYGNRSSAQYGYFDALNYYGYLMIGDGTYKETYLALTNSYCYTSFRCDSYILTYYAGKIGDKDYSNNIDKNILDESYKEIKTLFELIENSFEGTDDSYGCKYKMKIYSRYKNEEFNLLIETIFSEDKKSISEIRVNYYNDTEVTSESSGLIIDNENSYTFVTGPPHPNISDMGNSTILKIEKSKIDSYIHFYKKDENSTAESLYTAFEKEFISRYTASNSCPTLYFGRDMTNIIQMWYVAFDPSDFEFEEYGMAEYQASDGYNNLLFSGKTNSAVSNILITYDNCQDLFGDSTDLVDMLATIVNIVKIFIPIIIIGMGILDFAKAIFESSEENMKKAQTKFLKRVIIGVCIFLIPTLLQLLLEIANSIWGNISTDFCGIL